MKSNYSQSKLKSANINLNDAFKIKKDEFYTLYEDVEKEMLNYTSKFKGKTVICNCDDPFESAFFHFFLIHLHYFQKFSRFAVSLRDPISVALVRPNVRDMEL